VTLGEFVRTLSIGVMNFYSAMEKTGASGMKLSPDAWLKLFISWFEETTNNGT
jgi:hypothetical protein